MATFPIPPPVEPMLAKLSDAIPEGDTWLYEPKWDGFRALVFRGGPGEVYIQSRDLKPLDRYFPDLHDPFLTLLPDGCVLDGEIVIASEGGLDFDTLQLRLHPAASRVAKLAAAAPASFVAFDLLAADHTSLMERPQHARREALETLLRDVGFTDLPDAVDPRRRDRDVTGCSASKAPGSTASSPNRPTRLTSQASARCSRSSTHAPPTAWSPASAGTRAAATRSAPCFSASTTTTASSSTSASRRRSRWRRARQLAVELEPLRADALANHPWGEWADAQAHMSSRMPGGQSRWSAGKDLSWEPLRIERVCEVKYDHMQGDRFRHAAVFMRWRPDKAPGDCRYDQLEVTTPFELEKVFGAGRPLGRRAATLGRRAPTLRGRIGIERFLRRP